MSSIQNVSAFSGLCNISYVRVKRSLEPIEVVTRKVAKKYAVVDPQGTCDEKSSTLARLTQGAGRAMDIKITDKSGAVLMNIARPFKLWHKNQNMKLIGTVFHIFSVGKAIFHVMNGQDEQLFTICGFIIGREFTITNSKGTEVGYIQKEWTGFLQEAFTDAGNFSVHFPAGSGGETRALLIAATLFIDLSHLKK